MRGGHWPGNHSALAWIFPDNAGRDAVTPRRPFRPARRQQGLTLVEQVTVLAIVGVLASLASPSLGRLLHRNALQAAQTDFIAALHHARETAVTSGKRTLFCPSVDGAHCSDAAHWENGWLIGHDADRDDQPDCGALRVGHGYAGRLAIRSGSGRRVVRFYPDGSASGSNLTLVFCTLSGTARALTAVVANSGRIRGAPASARQAASCAAPD